MISYVLILYWILTVALYLMIPGSANSVVPTWFASDWFIFVTCFENLLILEFFKLPIRNAFLCLFEGLSKGCQIFDQISDHSAVHLKSAF